MPTRGSLGDRIRLERARRFVGREAERARFAAILAGDSSAAVLWVHGPGGVGKTTLLARLRDDAEAAGRKTVALDARDVDPEPAAIFGAIARALGLPETEAVPDALADAPHVLTIDTYERFETLDGWVRTDLVPSLPDRTLLIVAGRTAPTAWRVDPSLSGLIEVIGLRNLAREEADEMLARRGVVPERREALCKATHGHPLALALVADLQRDEQAAGFRLEEAPDVVGVLLDQLVRSVPSARHRQALFLAAEVLVSTEELLRDAFGADPAPALYEWLRGLSIIERGPRGLFPHDVAREVLSAELRARDPDACRALHRSARGLLIRSLDATIDPRERTRIMVEAVYLHRHNPTMRGFIDQRYGTVRSEPLPPAEVDAAVSMVAARAGSEVASVLARWIDLLPEGVAVYRDPAGEIEAVSGLFDLDREQLVKVSFDPGMARIRAYLERHGGVGDEDLVHVGRFFVHRAVGTPAQPALNELQARMGARWLAMPRLTSSFVMLGTRRREPGREVRDPWARILEYGDHPRIDELGFSLGEIDYQVHGHDWRRTPREAWLERLASLELTTLESPARVERKRDAAFVALSEPEFRTAVRAALKDYQRDEALARNPLLRSRALYAAGAEARPAGLRALVGEAARTLEQHPRDEKLFRALRSAYLEPAKTQELAAERLGLPFSTYRRHLTSAIERVADWLWQREMGGA